MFKQIIIVIALCVLLAAPAFAQTTWNPSDMAPGITLSGGNLTATSAATNVQKIVRATVAKYTGKWCYEFHLNNAASGQVSIGVSNSDLPVTFQGLSLGFTDFAVGIYFIDGSGIGAWTQHVDWNDSNVGGATADPPVGGKTGEVCLDLDNQPPQIWITPDITGTGGAGGGPLWNGNTVADPASGVGGGWIYLPSLQYFPTFDGFNNDSVTGIFTGFTPPTGFSTWDTTGGAAPIPGPLNPLTIVVNNAPAWAASTGYSIGNRVVAGAAWNGSVFTNGAALCAFAVQTAGTSGTDPTVFNTACASGAQAGYGGGFTGTIPSQWSTAASVTDGTATWKLISRVDYTSITALNADSPTTWAPNTGYNFETYLTNGSNGYSTCPGDNECDPINGANNPICTSASSGPGPIGTTPDVGITDGTCTWYFIGTVPYTSQTARYPHIYTLSNLPQNNLLQGYYYDINILLEYGGTAQNQYWAGHNNERISHVLLSDHFTDLGEFGVGCYHAFFNTAFTVVTQHECKTASTTYKVIVEPYPGDGWQDNVTASVGPLGIYDPTKGVAIYSDAAYTVGFSGWSVFGVALEDDVPWHNGLQLKGLHGPAIHTGTNGGFELSNSIMEGGDTTPVVAYTASGIYRVHDNLLISHSVDNGCMAIFNKYHSSVYNNTAIGPNNPNCTFYGVENGAGIGGWTSATPPPFANNLVFGFPNFFAYGPQGPLGGSFANNVGNASDMPSCCGAAFTTAADFIYGATTYTPQDISAFQNTCGPSNTASCLNLSASTNVVNPTIGSSLDMRIKTGAAVVGSGGFFSAQGASPAPAIATPASTDIFGNARPTSPSRYDTGAEQFVGTVPPPSRGPGRFMRGDNFMPFVSVSR